MQVYGVNVVLVDEMTDGTIRYRPDPLEVVMSSKTLMWLCNTPSALLHQQIQDDIAEMRSSMVIAAVKDYRRWAPGGRVPETRKPVQPVTDRYELLTAGLTRLASQMAQFTSGKSSPTVDQVRGFASRYGELTKLRADLAAALMHADGLLEVVQTQVRVVME